MEDTIADNKKKLLEDITTYFPDHEIITLGDIVKNISNCPSVRGGDKKKLDFLDYYEVGLRDCNIYGVIEIDPSSKKKLGAANKSMVFKYKLHKNDLLLPYKVSRQIKVARIGKEYDLPMVTNTSTTRIEMYDETPQELAIIIQAYFDLPYVQHYLISSSKAHLSKRAPLKPQILSELPIPRFQIDSHIDYKTIYNKNAEIQNISTQIYNYSSKLRYSTDVYQETASHFFASSVEESSELLKDDILNRLKKLLEELKNIEDIAFKANTDILRKFPEHCLFYHKKG